MKSRAFSTFSCDITTRSIAPHHRWARLRAGGGLRLLSVLDEVNAPPLALEAELPPAAVHALVLGGRARQRAHRHPEWAVAGGDRGRALGRERSTRADVVLRHVVVCGVEEVARVCDVDAASVRGHHAVTSILISHSAQVAFMWAGETPVPGRDPYTRARARG